MKTHAYHPNGCFFNAILLLFMLFAGCVDTHPIVEPEPEPDTTVEPEPPPSANEIPSLSFGVPTSVFEAFRAVLNSNNSGVQFIGESPMNFTRPEGSLRIPVGARMFWETTENEIVFTFKDPKPDVRTKVWVAKVNPYLVQIRLHPDDSMQADVEGDLYKKTLKYNLTEIQTQLNQGSGAADLPEVWCWDCTNYCTKESKRQSELAKAEFAKHAETLGFTPVWKTDAPPTWMPQGRPAFWIPVGGDKPDPDDKYQKRYVIGFTNLQSFLATFRATRALKVSAAASSGTPFAQPDHSGSRAVARGSLVYNASHNCPHCGRSQYDIDDDDGPGSHTHIHKCDHCGTRWYHADQPRSNGRAKSFLGITWN